MPPPRTARVAPPDSLTRKLPPVQSSAVGSGPAARLAGTPESAHGLQLRPGVSPQSSMPGPLVALDAQRPAIADCKGSGARRLPATQRILRAPFLHGHRTILPGAPAAVRVRPFDAALFQAAHRNFCGAQRCRIRCLPAAAEMLRFLCHNTNSALVGTLCTMTQLYPKLPINSSE